MVWNTEFKQWYSETKRQKREDGIRNSISWTRTRRQYRKDEPGIQGMKFAIYNGEDLESKEWNADS